MTDHIASRPGHGPRLSEMHGEARKPGHPKRLTRSYEVPDKRTQDAFRAKVKANPNVLDCNLAEELGIDADVATKMRRFFRSIVAGGLGTFLYYGEKKHLGPNGLYLAVLCADCGAVVNRSTNGLCRKCFVGPLGECKKIEVEETEYRHPWATPMEPEVGGCKEPAIRLDQLSVEELIKRDAEIINRMVWDRSSDWSHVPSMREESERGRCHHNGQIIEE